MFQLFKLFKLYSKLAQSLCSILTLARLCLGPAIVFLCPDSVDPLLPATQPGRATGSGNPLTPWVSRGEGKPPGAGM